MKRSYAVVWSDGRGTGAGRLEPRDDVLELLGREQRLAIAFTEVTGASIRRGAHDRLRGLPVLELALRAGAPVRIASLEGGGALHELAALVEHARVAVAV